ncbi:MULTISPECIES: NeuD/PglB/VioB family sugar acetyltransferase [unclassified Candidatus Accumulibacter]|uniref:NeuD/PglB/VioB family sugar acetyltransferase n=1 Tax=unclassified Candidatus Accumulibacter TaxID=2619054 RepID=UPI001ACFECD9|nr:MULTISPECIES: NeuD/PglB/VioB family sugar acetyltransferase [unclassified Candidatus Accumulibacter]MBN8514233.1 NeuD/PglB/VioB family sugar acetyltransferase [Accumulibacter sp.]MBO3701541.1 NeuD/PglB/VioB family sugar acetyltransferase [Accumulibacter sp.]HRI90181.1 NeuD/PglB/VioB family sugar acetyltransferase [Accumulibacter sp.]
MDDGARYVLWGSGGHAKVLASLISLRGGTVAALVDNDREAVAVLPGVPLHIGKEELLRWCEAEAKGGPLYGLAAIGGARGADRLAVQACFRSLKVRVEPLVHPHASVCSTAVLGPGTQVLAGAVVAADVRLGEACIVNHQALADHECVLGDGVHLAPGATLCGCVSLGNNVMIGAGAVVSPRVTIGAGTVVGAGAVVIRDLPAGVVVAGNPARIIRSMQPGHV